MIDTFRGARIIFKKEWKLFVYSSFTYILFAGTAFFNALFFIFFLGEGRTNYLEAMRDLYYTFHGTMMIPCIIVSMFSFTREYQDQTMELLYTSPITDWEIVLGKFLFGLVFVFLNLVFLNLFFTPLLLIFWKAPINEILVGNIGLFLLGMASISVGLFSSTLTRNPFVAMLYSFLILGPMSIIGSISFVFPNPLKQFLEYLSIYFHYIKFTAGVISIKNTLFFLSMTFFFLFMALRVIESRRWRG